MLFSNFLKLIILKYLMWGVVLEFLPLNLPELVAGEIVAIDIDQTSLDHLDEKIKSEKLEKHVKTLNCSLLDLDFPDESFDIIWAEGSMFAIGFQKGLEDWRRLIKNNGFLVVHDPYPKPGKKWISLENQGTSCWILLLCIIVFGGLNSSGPMKTH
jgi:Methylase involved in ubiquinone/menaquinone biosynthesis